MEDAALSYVSYFESVQLAVVLGIGAWGVVWLITRHFKKIQRAKYQREAETRRFDMLEREKRPPPPAINN